MDQTSPNSAPKPENKILLIEDDSDIRSSIVEILTEEGFHMEWAANGEDALEKLRAANPMPNLILLDLRLPVKDGFQFREEQRKDPRIADIPVVVLSADGKLHEKTSQMGARELLRKPINIDDLVTTVRRNIH